MLPTNMQKLHLYGVSLGINMTQPHFPDECLLHLVSPVMLTVSLLQG